MADARRGKHRIGAQHDALRPDEPMPNWFVLPSDVDAGRGTTAEEQRLTGLPPEPRQAYPARHRA
jgi:hypothetical protein